MMLGSVESAVNKNGSSSDIIMSIMHALLRSWTITSEHDRRQQSPYREGGGGVTDNTAIYR